MTDDLARAEIEAMALAIWQARDADFPARVRRPTPDAMDHASGAWNYVLNWAAAAHTAASRVREERGFRLLDRERAEKTYLELYDQYPDARQALTILRAVAWAIRPASPEEIDAMLAASQQRTADNG